MFLLGEHYSCGLVFVCGGLLWIAFCSLSPDFFVTSTYELNIRATHYQANEQADGGRMFHNVKSK